MSYSAACECCGVNSVSLRASRPSNLGRDLLALHGIHPPGLNDLIRPGQMLAPPPIPKATPDPCRRAVAPEQKPEKVV